MPISTGLLIADSSPLIALARLSLLDLPTRLFGRVAVPDVVYRECTEQFGLPGAQTIQDAVSNGLIEVLPDLAWPDLIVKPRLNAGEISAIALALELNATLLIDELRGRQVAMNLRIPVVGVCGLLIDAKRRGWIDALAPRLDLLRESGYYISPALRQAVLTMAGEL